MSYTYSICHPNKSKIEHPKEVLSNVQVVKMVEQYPWMKILNSIDYEQVQYNPSLSFVNVETNYGLELTAEEKDGKLSFSLWFNRPITRKILFGILGNKTTMKVIEKWSINKETALQYLNTYLNKDYQKMEKLMR